jgi:O-antigen/teichoic acid export membrane protein
VSRDLDAAESRPEAHEDDRGDDPRSTWLNVLRSAGVRILVLPLSAVLGIIITRLIIDSYGKAAYAQYGLLVGIGALLPWADLGISAAVMNAIAGSSDPSADRRVRRVLVTAIRVLSMSATVLVLVALALGVSGLWPAVLGDGLNERTGALTATLCLVLIAVAMPFGVGQRILAGLGKNHVSIALGGLQSPMVLAVLAVVLWLNLSVGPYIAVIPYATTFLIAVLSCVVAGRMIRPMLSRVRRAAPRLRSEPGAKVFDVAWPMLVQMIALPIAMQTDRLVLSHVGGSGPLAEYNLASQMYTPIWQVVSAAGFTLWPVFARARVRGTSRSPLPMAAVFGAAAAGLALVITVASPLLAELASGGEIHLGATLVISFSLLMVFQALKYPLGMYMTDARGLRYQALMVVLMLPVNLGLSWYLAGVLGAAGPVIGSAVGVLVFQVLANLVYVRRVHAQVTG